jgi:hypothetical protein
MQSHSSRDRRFRLARHPPYPRCMAHGDKKPLALSPRKSHGWSLVAHHSALKLHGRHEHAPQDRLVARRKGKDVPPCPHGMTPPTWHAPATGCQAPIPAKSTAFWRAHAPHARPREPAFSLNRQPVDRRGSVSCPSAPPLGEHASHRLGERPHAVSQHFIEPRGAREPLGRLSRRRASR